MPCFHPLTGYRSKAGRNASGKWPVVFNLVEGISDEVVTLPCGNCVGCRLERSRQWAMRCVHEASLYQNNCFVTLTYNDESLRRLNRRVDLDTGEIFCSLNKRDVMLFMKKLRKRFGSGIRFFSVVNMVLLVFVLTIMCYCSILIFLTSFMPKHGMVFGCIVLIV